MTDNVKSVVKEYIHTGVGDGHAANTAGYKIKYEKED
jgi:hypothetical protein